MSGAADDYDAFKQAKILDLLSEAAGLSDATTSKAPAGSRLTLVAASVSLSAAITASSPARAEAAGRRFRSAVPSGTALAQFFAWRGLEGITVEAGPSVSVVALPNGAVTADLSVFGILIASCVLFFCAISTCLYVRCVAKLRATPPPERDIRLRIRGNYNKFKADTPAQILLIRKFAAICGISPYRVRILQMKGGSVVITIRIYAPPKLTALEELTALEDGFSKASADDVHQHVLAMTPAAFGHAIGHRVIVHRDSTLRDRDGEPISHAVRFANQVSDAALVVGSVGMGVLILVGNMIGVMVTWSTDCCMFYRELCRTGSVERAGEKTARVKVIPTSQKHPKLVHVRPPKVDKRAEQARIPRIRGKAQREREAQLDEKSLWTSGSRTLMGFQKSARNMFSIAHAEATRREDEELARLEAEELARFKAEMAEKAAILVAKAQADLEAQARYEAEAEERARREEEERQQFDVEGARQLALLEHEIMSARFAGERHPDDPVPGPVRDVERLVSLELQPGSKGSVLVALRTGPGVDTKRDRAATALQSGARGKKAKDKAKKKAKEKVQETDAATTVQAAVRSGEAKKKKKKLQEEKALPEAEQEERAGAATAVQSKQRGKKGKEKAKKKQKENDDQKELVNAEAELPEEVKEVRNDAATKLQAKKREKAAKAEAAKLKKEQAKAEKKRLEDRQVAAAVTVDKGGSVKLDLKPLTPPWVAKEQKKAKVNDIYSECRSSEYLSNALHTHTHTHAHTRSAPLCLRCPCAPRPAVQIEEKLQKGEKKQKEKKEDDAATKVQAKVRGKKAKEQTAELAKEKQEKKEDTAATAIQGKMRVKKAKEEKNERAVKKQEVKEEAAAVVVQSKQRAQKAKAETKQLAQEKAAKEQAKAEDKAATAVQAKQRAQKAKAETKQLVKEKTEAKAATVVQTQMRGKQAKKEKEEKVKQKKEKEENAAATAVQSKVRAAKAKEEAKAKAAEKKAKEEAKAATALQAAKRGQQAKAEVAEKRAKKQAEKVEADNKAATKVQSQIRAKNAKIESEQKRKEKLAKELEAKKRAAEVVQSQHRGRAARGQVKFLAAEKALPEGVKKERSSAATLIAAARRAHKANLVMAVLRKVRREAAAATLIAAARRAQKANSVMAVLRKVRQEEQESERRIRQAMQSLVRVRQARAQRKLLAQAAQLAELLGVSRWAALWQLRLQAEANEQANEPSTTRKDLWSGATLSQSSTTPTDAEKDEIRKRIHRRQELARAEKAAAEKAAAKKAAAARAAERAAAVELAAKERLRKRARRLWSLLAKHWRRAVQIELRAMGLEPKADPANNFAQAVQKKHGIFKEFREAYPNYPLGPLPAPKSTRDAPAPPPSAGLRRPPTSELPPPAPKPSRPASAALPTEYAARKAGGPTPLTKQRCQSAGPSQLTLERSHPSCMLSSAGHKSIRLGATLSTSQSEASLPGGPPIKHNQLLRKTSSSAQLPLFDVEDDCGEYGARSQASFASRAPEPQPLASPPKDPWADFDDDATWADPVPMRGRPGSAARIVQAARSGAPASPVPDSTMRMVQQFQSREPCYPAVEPHPAGRSRPRNIQSAPRSREAAQTMQAMGAMQARMGSQQAAQLRPATAQSRCGAQGSLGRLPAGSSVALPTIAGPIRASASLSELRLTTPASMQPLSRPLTLDDLEPDEELSEYGTPAPGTAVQRLRESRSQQRLTKPPTKAYIVLKR